MTATLLSVADLREHVETDLSDMALQRVLDSEEGEIIGRYGAHATTSDALDGSRLWLMLSRPPASITTVTEYINTEATVLAANDYRDWGGGRLERLYNGTHPRLEWGDWVQIVYTPRDETAQRTLALVQLCKLAIAYAGVKSESVGSGDYQMTALEYNVERNQILRSLAPRRMVFA